MGDKNLLWAPKNRGDQAILANHAPGAASPPDPELIEIGGSFG